MEIPMDFFDSHFHLVELAKAAGDSPVDFGQIRGCSCALGPEEFEIMEKICQRNRQILPAFGIHPQNPDEKLVPYLENLLLNRRIAAVGEIGFDFFSPDDRKNRPAQEKVWKKCLDLAIEYGFPVVIHNRKSMDMIYSSIAELSHVTAVMFHSFPFGPVESRAILDRGVNAYFSFGKNLIRGSVRNRECIKSLPLDRILLETDAPFQTLGPESFTKSTDIELVYREAAVQSRVDFEDFVGAVGNNFSRFFSGSPYLHSSGNDASSTFIASTAVT